MECYGERILLAYNIVDALEELDAANKKSKMNRKLYRRMVVLNEEILDYCHTLREVQGTKVFAS